MKKINYKSRNFAAFDPDIMDVMENFVNSKSFEEVNEITCFQEEVKLKTNHVIYFYYGLKDVETGLYCCFIAKKDFSLIDLVEDTIGSCTFYVS